MTASAEAAGTQAAPGVQAVEVGAVGAAEVARLRAVPAVGADFFVDGQWQNASSGKPMLAVVCPATKERIAEVGVASAADVDQCVQAAHRALQSTEWRKDHKFRATVLRKLAVLVKEHRQRLSRLETYDCGKAVEETEWDMDDVKSALEYYADMAEKLEQRQVEEVDVDFPGFKAQVHLEPIGVVAAIVPWNYPLLMATWKVAPALGAGCAVVLKPSEETPLTALEFAQLALEAGVPPGVFNVVVGGPETGASLTSHPKVARVAFTGSCATGQKVLEACAPSSRNASVELGGKSAAVVFDGVDVDKVAEWIMFGCFWTNGQICSSTSRLLVQKGVASRLLAKLQEETAKVPMCRLGELLEGGLDKTSGRLGPLVSAKQLKKVLCMVEGAKKDGVTVLCGGSSGFQDGFYFQPTILTNVRPGMEVWTEEIFGPVLSVMEFEHADEALRLANESEYGLAAAVFSPDDAVCNRFAREFECGIVWVNCSQPCFGQLPWGGRKKSGVGRDNGTFAFNSYLEPKQVVTYTSKDYFGWFSPRFGNAKL